MMKGCEKCEYTGFAWGRIPCECTDKIVDITKLVEAMNKIEIINVNTRLDSDRECTCHCGHPPCGYCVEGGYCQEHDCMRNECGCEI